MKINVENDALVDLYEQHPDLPDHLEEFFEDSLIIRNKIINPAHFVRFIDLSQIDEIYKKVLDKNYNPEYAAPVGARDYLEILRSKMEEHPQDHSRSIAVIDRLIPLTQTTSDNIGNGLLGEYSYGKQTNPEKMLSLDDPDACAQVLENFRTLDYQPAILKLLGRFNVEWPTLEVKVEPVMTFEDEVEADMEYDV